MSTSLGMRTLGDIFEEAKQEQKEARERGMMPKGKRRLAEVFDEAKRDNEELRRRGTFVRKRIDGQRDAEVVEAGKKDTDNAAEVLVPMDQRNGQNILRAGLGMHSSAEIFEASQKEYDEARVRGETKRRRLRGTISNAEIYAIADKKSR